MLASDRDSPSGRNTDELAALSQRNDTKAPGGGEDTPIFRPNIFWEGGRIVMLCDDSKDADGLRNMATAVSTDYSNVPFAREDVAQTTNTTTLVDEKQCVVGGAITDVLILMVAAALVMLKVLSRRSTSSPVRVLPQTSLFRASQRMCEQPPPPQSAPIIQTLPVMLLPVYAESDPPLSDFELSPLSSWSRSLSRFSAEVEWQQRARVAALAAANDSGVLRVRLSLDASSKVLGLSLFIVLPGMETAPSSAAEGVPVAGNSALRAMVALRHTFCDDRRALTGDNTQEPCGSASPLLMLCTAPAGDTTYDALSRESSRHRQRSVVPLSTVSVYCVSLASAIAAANEARILYINRNCEATGRRDMGLGLAVATPSTSSIASTGTDADEPEAASRGTQIAPPRLGSVEKTAGIAHVTSVISSLEGKTVTASDRSSPVEGIEDVSATSAAMEPPPAGRTKSRGGLAGILGGKKISASSMLLSLDNGGDSFLSKLSRRTGGRSSKKSAGRPIISAAGDSDSSAVATSRPPTVKRCASQRKVATVSDQTMQFRGTKREARKALYTLMSPSIEASLADSTSRTDAGSVDFAAHTSKEGRRDSDAGRGESTEPQMADEGPVKGGQRSEAIVSSGLRSCFKGRSGLPSKADALPLGEKLQVCWSVRLDVSGIDDRARRSHAYRHHAISLSRSEDPERRKARHELQQEEREAQGLSRFRTRASPAKAAPRVSRAQLLSEAGEREESGRSKTIEGISDHGERLARERQQRAARWMNWSMSRASLATAAPRPSRALELSKASDREDSVSIDKLVAASKEKARMARERRERAEVWMNWSTSFSGVPKGYSSKPEAASALAATPTPTTSPGY